MLCSHSEKCCQPSLPDVTFCSYLLAGISFPLVEHNNHKDARVMKKTITGIDRLPEVSIFYGKERGSIGTRTCLAFPSAKADFVHKGVKI